MAQSPSSPQPQVDSRAAEASTAAQYRMQLIAYAQRNKPPYPRLARENNWAGEVTLEITLRADGQAELGLRRGSGYEVLDKLALDTYQQALRAVPLPPALRGRQVKLEPLRFSRKRFVPASALVRSKLLSSMSRPTLTTWWPAP